MKLKNILVITVLFVAFIAKSQEVDKKILNWYNGKKYGMETDKAYKKLLSDRKAKTVIVAVLDSGVDVEHEDLREVIWTNTAEIASNGIDDDKNGYIDDIHGWNFLGNADGENINDVQFEMTRIYSDLEKRFKGKSYADLNDEEKVDYDLYKEVREKVEREIEESKENLDRYTKFCDMFSESDTRLKKHFGGEYTAKDLKGLKDARFTKDVSMMKRLYDNDSNLEDLVEGKEYFESSLKYHYNTELETRKIVGDDPNNFEDKFYGNSDVEGPEAMHGSHCSGIIAAIRGNGLGGDGVANNVLIMPIRAVPNGDERDKDIALGIRYAVDNGANIINMSFGKAYSPNSIEVIAAIKYAEEKGVLCVHASGNAGLDIDDQDKNRNFPSPQYPEMSARFTNWIEVGASTRYKKQLAASFSNYGDKTVDVFAPGLEIYSTVPQSEYIAIQGTSMAAPMVAGLAALLKGYFPELTMFQIKDIIFKSVQKIDRTTMIPGGDTEVNFSELSITGGIVNTYNAVEMAIAMTTK